MIIILLHIVRSGENISQIADMYHCDINDIKGNNLHITDFKKLMPGTKLKIPFLNKEVIDTLEETESFISDYYPKFEGKINDVKAEKQKENFVEKSVEKTEEIPLENKEIVEEKKPQISENSNINIPRYNVNYFGNIPPRISEKFIRKI